MNADDTIAAIASAPGGAHRGIIRLSGPGVVHCVIQCCDDVDADRIAATAQPTVLPIRITVPGPVGTIPCDLHLWPTSRSYTRQPSAELHTLGSPPLLNALLRLVCQRGARLADPGEFTLRAFLAGRLDLTQAEAVLGVIDAQSQHELDIALSQLAGGLAKPLDELRNRLLDLLAHLEAGLDFVDEDIQFITTDQLTDEIDRAAKIVDEVSARFDFRGESTGDFRITLIGWPNVGKSMLWNALTGEGKALVSAGAGTTRDYLRGRVDMNGLSCELVDTAGVELEDADEIRSAAQSMSTKQAAQAHLRLLCLDATRSLNRWEQKQVAGPERDDRLLVLTKCDGLRIANLDRPAIATSGLRGEGLQELKQAIVARLQAASNGECGSVAGTAIRCRDSLRLTGEALLQARQAVLLEAGEEVVAAELRIALDELGKIVGAVYTEDVLERIFGRFCIGK